LVTDLNSLELLHELHRLRAMLDAAMDAVIALDENQRIELFNPAAEKMFQYRAADVIGKPLNVLLPDRYRSKHHDNIESFRTSDQTERHAGDLGVVRGLRADGSEFPLEVAISRSTVGGRTTLTAIARDATSRLEMQADARASAARYQLLFEHSPLPMWVYDVESLRFVAVNDAAVADYGYGREEFLAMTIREIRPPDELQNLHVNLAASSQARQRSGPWKHLRKDGTLREVEILSHEVEFSRRAARLVVVNDITERLQAERARREGERQLAALIASLDDIVFEFDADGIYRHVWARDESLLARPRTEMLGRSIVEVLGEDAGRPFTLACQRAIKTGQPEEIEYSLQVGSGQRWFVARVSPVLDADGRRLTASMLIREITERKAAQNTLRQSTERFRRYFELGVVGMVISSPTTGMLEANDQICTMLHYTREELLRKTWPEVTHPEDVGADLALFRQLLAGEIPSYEMEKRFVRKDGVVLHAHMSVSCVRSPGGAAELLLALIQDITEQKRAEQALREAEARYRSIFENATEAITQTTPDGHYLAANPATARMLGYQSTDVLIHDPHALERRFYVQPGRRQEFTNLMEQEGAISGFESEVFRKDGTTIWISENSRLVRDADGHILYYEGTAQDITARKLAELALHASNEELEALIRTAPVGVVVLDRDGNLLRWNPSCEQMFGWTEAEVLGKPLPYVPSNLIEQHRSLRERVLRGESFTGVEVSRVRKDGSPIELSIFTAPLRDAAGDVTSILGLNLDITERRREHEKLQQAEARYRLLVEGVPAITYVIEAGPPYRTLYISPQVERVLGFTQQEWMETPGLWERQLHPDDRERVLEEDRSSRRQETTFLSEYRIFGKDGRVVWLRDETHHIQEQGLPPFSQGIEFDITERKQAEEQIRRQLDQMAALRRIDAAIGGTFDLKVMLSIVLENISQVLDADATSISLLAPESMLMEVVAARGFRTAQIHSAPLALSAGVGMKVMLERRSIHTGDLSMAAEAGRRRDLMQAEGFVSYFGIPLVAKGRVTGLLEIFQRSSRERTDDWLRLADALAAQAAIAIDSASMFQDLQRSNVDLAIAYEATIEGWSRALDLRDKETEGHTLRVTELTLKLARSLGVQAEDLMHMRRGALLHDIGKIGVPDSILLKPGPLTDAEWVVMRRHPTVAHEMLSPISHLRQSLDIPYCHHEKWDGSGYPRGLNREEIPLPARIFAVVDVWDALCSERPYRPAWPVEKVLDHIRAGSGTHFDPVIADAFLRMMTEA
jgi:PAS domain S-box-containing protein/putative nucleotidyltransferase with HDIG domain